MTVEIGDGRTGTITVRRGDIALDLAKAFAAEHGLDASVVGPLEGHIEGNVRAAERKREARKAESARAAPAFRALHKPTRIAFLFIHVSCGVAIFRFTAFVVYIYIFFTFPSQLFRFHLFFFFFFFSSDKHVLLTNTYYIVY